MNDCGICGGYDRLWFGWFCPVCLGVPFAIVVMLFVGIAFAVKVF